MYKGIVYKGTDSYKILLNIITSVNKFFLLDFP